MSTPFDALPGRPNDCASHLVLDKIAVGQPVAPPWAQHVRTCQRCTHEVAARQDAARAFSADHDLVALSARTVMRMRAQPNRWRALARSPRRGLRTVLASTAAAGLLYAAMLPKQDDVRTKGGAAFSVLALVNDKTTILRAGDTVAPGVPLRFLVDLPAPTWVAVLGRDGLGNIWRGAPEHGDTMLRLPAGKGQPLPGAVALDGRGDTETVVLFTCRSPTSLLRLTASLALKGGETHPGCTRHALRLQKAVPRSRSP